VRRIIPLRIEEDTDLRATVESFRLIQQRVSDLAFARGGNLSAIDLHQLSYAHVKGQLKSQLTCTAIRLVAGEYASARRRHKRLTSPVQFNAPRALFLIGNAKRDASAPKVGEIKVWTTAGRKSIRCSVPAQFESSLKDVKSFDALAVSIKRGRLVATLSVTMKTVSPIGNKPVGVSLSVSNEMAVVAADDRSMRVITTAQSIMEETYRKTKQRLEKKLSARKADGHETRSVRRALKRLSRRQHLRIRTFCHVAANHLLRWVGKDAVIVVEDLRKRPPSRRSKASKSRPHYYEVLRRRIEEKAERAGVPVFYASIDSARRCAQCGAAGEVKHKHLRCSCGSSTPVSRNAALNIRNKFTVSRPWAGANQS
jgi:hypothetical protein